MSIQFLCPGCSQPIEVDSEFGGSMVGCPYCRKTVTAPRQSTLQSGAGPATAKPMVTPSAGPYPPGAYAPVVEIPSRNIVAVVAFFFSLITVFFFAIFSLTAGRNLTELQTIQREFEGLQQRSANKADADVQQELTEFMEGLPQWFWMMGGGFCAALPCGLTALVCGIIGVCRPRRRGWAVAALVLLVAGPMVLCFLPAGATGPNPPGEIQVPQPLDAPDAPVDGKENGKVM